MTMTMPRPLANPDRRRAGFTLIELFVVMTVIAVVTSAVAIGIGNIRGASVQSESGKMVAAIRYLYTLSVLNGKNYRLVVDVSEGSYWGEMQDSRDPCKAFLLSDEDEDKEADKKDAEEDEAQPATASFGLAKSRLLKKRKLPKGIAFGGVMTSHQSELSVDGQAHVNFFPNGTAEAAMLYIQDADDDEDVMTVEVLSLQGSARIYDDKLSLDEFFDQG
jgi:type II secretion system protein H